MSKNELSPLDRFKVAMGSSLKEESEPEKPIPPKKGTTKGPKSRPKIIIDKEDVIAHMKKMENKHAKYIVKALTVEGNNTNYVGYKLEYLISEYPKIKKVKKK